MRYPSFSLCFSACYDNTVCLWDAKDGSKKQQIPSHVSPVRDVAFIDVDENMNATFVSVSHDQTVVLHKYCSESNSIEGMYTQITNRPALLDLFFIFSVFSMVLSSVSFVFFAK